ncbi:MAG: hypothetical protein JO131_08320 [Gammaproteobacteria bacterium]|nr:hypothetical protein [Gammaproteobacteria bacterium]
MEARLLVFIFFFGLSQIANAADIIKPLDKTKTQAQQSYVMTILPSNVTSDLNAFLTNPKNLCATSETRNVCFVQYTVKPVTATATTPPYQITNSALQCPVNYVPAGFMGNSALDPNSPHDKIYYYDSVYIVAANLSEYNAYHSSNYCKQGPLYKVKNVCVWADCDPLSHIYGENSGFYSGVADPYEIYVTTSTTGYRGTFNQDFSGFHKCDWYPHDCGPSPLCQTCRMINVYYYYTTCTVPGGYYLNTANPTAPVSASHTPSTVICVKPVIKWQNAPVTPKAQS